jgi:hypothetical protein
VCKRDVWRDQRISWRGSLRSCQREEDIATTIFMNLSYLSPQYFSRFLKPNEMPLFFFFTKYFFKQNHLFRKKYVPNTDFPNLSILIG